MEKSLPRRLDSLREHVAMLSLYMSVQHNVCECLDEIAVRIYSLEEDRKRLLENVRVQQSEIDSLKSSFSDLFYRFSMK